MEGAVNPLNRLDELTYTHPLLLIPFPDVQATADSLPTHFNRSVVCVEN